MNASSALSWLNAPAWLPLIHALLHTFWQGALAAGGLYLVVRLVPTRHANLRYGLGVAALASVVLAGVGLWALLDAPRQASVGLHGIQPAMADDGRLLEQAISPVTAFLVASAGGLSPRREAGVDSGMTSVEAFPRESWVRCAAAGWLAGVFVFLLRAARGTWGAGRLRRRCQQAADPRVLALVEQLRACLGVSRRVQILICDEIGVPSMLGVLYPAVLLPVTMATGVPLAQLRAILAHELAHIRHWDYLTNLAQILVEALLFFNPFVWWISRQVRLEREACCDQIAAAACGSPADYVTALVAVIERGRAALAPPLLAASGPHGGNTLERARRLLVPGYRPSFRLHWLSLATVLVLAGSALGGLWWGTRAAAQAVRVAEEKTIPEPTHGPKAVPSMPDDALAAAREGNAKQALSLLAASRKPANFYEEDPASILDGLIRAQEVRAFTTLYDALQHFSARNWKPGDAGLNDLVSEGRTDFLNALIARRLDLDRLTKAAGSADPATAAWITRRVAEATKQRAGIEALEKAAEGNDLPALGRLVDDGIDVNGVGQDDNTPLIRAVFKDRLEAAQWLIDHGAQVDKPRLPDGGSYTPLSLVGSVPMAELLKKNGANMQARLFGGNESVLIYAVEQSKADVVAWFLKQGLDANAPTANQENLLFNLKDGTTAEVLLAAGADPNHVDEFGFSPLTSAHSAEVVRALVRRGANLKPEPRNGKTLLELAVSHMPRTDDTPEQEAGYIEELLRQGAEFDPEGNGLRAMLVAAQNDSVEGVRVFLDHGVSPDASYEGGPFTRASALSAAAISRGSDTLKLLLARGADPNAPVPAERLGPLDAALLAGAFDNVETLRRAGAKGLSDLAYASARGDAAKVGEVLAQRADPNESDPAGRTPLLHAVMQGQVGVARQLLEHGANADRFDLWGFSPSLYGVLYQKMLSSESDGVARSWHLSVPEAKARLAAFQELFRQYPPNPAYRNAAGRTALHQAAWTGGFFALSLMLEDKPPSFDPNALDKEGRPPLLLTALSPAAKELRSTFIAGARDIQIQNSQAHLAEKLLEAGARLDPVVADGKTVGELALAAARDAGNAQLVAVLEEAAKKAKPGFGTASLAPAPSTPLDSPAPGKDAVSAPKPPPGEDSLRNAAGEGRIEIVRRLLDHGANINSQDDHGFTPLSWAGYCGQEDVCLLLLARGADGRIEDRDGRNAAWHMAAGLHCAEALTRMIQAGVPVVGKDKQGNTILEYMLSFGVPGAGDKGFPNKVYTAADIERYDGNERRVVELLLAAGVDPNGGGGDVPLVRAMHNRHYAAARVLLAHGADPARKDKDGDTALYDLIGCAADHPLPLDLFKTLWQRSGSLNPEFTVQGVTPPQKTSLLEMLLDGTGVIDGAGLEPMQKPSFREAIKIMLDGGMTFAGVADANTQALLQAATRGDLVAIQRSVGQGAPVSAADDRDWDALSVTTALGYNDCADWLIEHGADVNGRHRGPWNAPLPRAIAGGQTDLVEELLAKGATLNGVYKGLYTAVRLKNMRIFEALLKAGADPKEKPMVTVSNGGKTFTPHDSVMLYLCIKDGQTDMARTLLDRGADADPPNLEDGRNLAWWAVDYNRPEILQSLLDHGANPRAKDDHGESALDLAREYHPKVVPMLEEAAKRKPAPNT